MKDGKNSVIRNGLFHTVCGILCAAAATGFAFIAMLMLLARMGGYHNLSYDQVFYEAMDRISANNMAMLANELTMGYDTTKEIVLEDPEGEYRKLKDCWKESVDYYGKLKNVNFAVIVSENENFEKINKDDEDLYFYKSPGYDGYTAHLTGRVFSTSYYTEWRSYRIVSDDSFPWIGTSRTDSYFETPLYVHVLYKTAPILTENPESHYDSMYTDKNLRSYLYCLYYMDAHGFMIAGLTAAASLLFLVLYCISAGYRRNKEGIYISLLDRIPLGIVWFAVGATEYTLIYIFYSMLKVFSRDVEDYLSFGEMIFLCCIVLFILLWIGVGFLGTHIVRIKSKTLWKSTALYHIKNFVFKWLDRSTMWIAKHLPIALIVLIALPFIGVISLIETALLEDWSRLVAFFFLIARLAVIALGLYLIWGYYKLREGAKRIAAGKLDEPVDEKHLFADYRLFARDLNGVGHSIQLAVDERMKSEHLKTQLITNVSHDIKTPLTSIINYVDLMGNEDTTEEEKKEYLDILTKQSGRLKKLIQDLIDASKASSGAVEVELSETDLSMMARQVMGEYQDKFEQAGLSLVPKNLDESMPVKADNNLLWRVMDNLFNNVLKYAMSGTRVYVEAKREGARATLSVLNISRAELGVSGDELMERFVRGDASRNTEGSGLGLSIARSLMELMGGSLKIIVDGDMFKAVIEI